MLGKGRSMLSTFYTVHGHFYPAAVKIGATHWENPELVLLFWGLSFLRMKSLFVLLEGKQIQVKWPLQLKRISSLFKSVHWQNLASFHSCVSLISRSKHSNPKKRGRLEKTKTKTKSTCDKYPRAVRGSCMWGTEITHADCECLMDAKGFILEANHKPDVQEPVGAELVLDISVHAAMGHTLSVYFVWVRYVRKCFCYFWSCHHI